VRYQCQQLAVNLDWDDKSCHDAGSRAGVARSEGMGAEDGRSPVPGSIKMCECSVRSVQRAGERGRKSREPEGGARCGAGSAVG